MDWNPLLNAVIREMNAGVQLAERWRTRGTGEDPLLDILAALCKELTKLELLSKASPPTMIGDHSSAHMTGPVTKQCPCCGANLEVTLAPIAVSQ